jgi:hypothetical protein
MTHGYRKMETHLRRVRLYNDHYSFDSCHVVGRIPPVHTSRMYVTRIVQIPFHGHHQCDVVYRLTD